MTTGRARIELLVRSEAGDDFRVTKVESSLAYRQARPQRIPEAQYEVAALRSVPGGVDVVLRHPGRHAGSVWIAFPGESRARRVHVRFTDAAIAHVPRERAGGRSYLLA